MKPSEINGHIEGAYKRINSYGYLMRELIGLNGQLVNSKLIQPCEKHNLSNCSVCSGFSLLKGKLDKLNRRLRAQETGEFPFKLENGTDGYFRGLQPYLKVIDNDIAYIMDRLQSGTVPKDRVAEVKMFEMRLGKCQRQLALTLLPVWERQIKSRIHQLIGQTANSELKNSLKHLAKFSGKEFWAIYGEHKEAFNEVFNIYNPRCNEHNVVSCSKCNPVNPMQAPKDVKFIPRQEEFNYDEDSSKYVESHTVKSEVATYDRKGGYKVVTLPVIVETEEIAANKSKYVSHETVGERTNVMPTTRKARRMSDSQYAAHVQRKVGIEHPIVNPSATFIEKPFRLNKPSGINKLKELAQSDDSE